MFKTKRALKSMESPWAYKQMKSQPRLPFPGHRHSNSPLEDATYSAPNLISSQLATITSAASRADALKILSDLATSDPGLIEEFILNTYRPHTIRKWLAIKTATLESQIESNKNSNSKGDIEGGAAVNEISDKCTKEFDIIISKVEKGSYREALYGVCQHLQYATLSSGFNFYGVSAGGDSLYLFNPTLKHGSTVNCLSKTRNGNINPVYPVGINNTVASYVAHIRQAVMVNDLRMDERFPKGSACPEANALICIPIILQSGDMIGVVEMYRTWENAPYTNETLHFAKHFLYWTSLAIHKSEVSCGLKQQSEMSAFLLEVSRTYLDDITDVDNIIQHIMRFAKSLVSADRCSLFLVDKQTNELYSDTFDNGAKNEGVDVFEKQPEIRFPITKGIVGSAAMNKKILNIPDAYADKRFNREVDKVTGYTTTSILCIPIISDGEVYGVVEMINKLGGGAFTMTDQNNFQMFAVFCALALRYSNIHARLRRDQCKLEVIREQYFYHSKYPEKDFQQLVESEQSGTSPSLPDDFDSFKLVMMDYNDELPGFFCAMVSELIQGCDLTVPIDVTSRFILCVRSNYRVTTYHNWHHAMTVVHAMYCILQRNLDLFEPIERLALLVACITHDVDHRALSNQFLQKTGHPLATLYKTSTMENHHLQMAIDILNREGHDVFCCMEKDEKEKAFYLIEEAILATDLALHFENRAAVEELLHKGEFDFDHPVHRIKAIGLMMTACDISSMTKSWESTRANVLDLHYEFWNEGDQRKQLGFSVIPMMDRDMQEDLPEGQVGFYSNVAVKCFETLTRVLPSCEELAQGAHENHARWRHEADELKATKDERSRKLLEAKMRDEQLKREGRGLTLRGGMWMVENSRTPI